MSFSSVAAGSQTRSTGQGVRSGHQSIPGLHVNGAPMGAQLLQEPQEVQEIGRVQAGWEVAGRRRPRARSPQMKRGADALEKQGEVKARARPSAKFGTRVVDMDGAEAAPVSFFIGNTNPKSVKENIEKVILQCANENNENKLKVEDIEVTSVTKVDNPRTRCWKLTVPNKWRETFRDDSFWPMGWSHRPWSNRSSDSGKESAKKQRTNSQSYSGTTEQTPLAGQAPPAPASGTPAAPQAPPATGGHAPMAVDTANVSGHQGPLQPAM